MSKKMLTTELPTETIDQPRRRFLGSAALSVAAAQLAVTASATGQTSRAGPKAAPAMPGKKASFDSVKQVNAGLLNVGYAEDGPSSGELAAGA
jgi:nitrous oxide reductase